jgi:hypothetical protein
MFWSTDGILVWFQIAICHINQAAETSSGLTSKCLRSCEVTGWMDRNYGIPRSEQDPPGVGQSLLIAVFFTVVNLTFVCNA